MARNDQLIRQWYLLRRLEGPRGASLADLVRSLPDDLARHGRTIRRDLEALEAAGGLYLIVYDHRRRDVRTFAVAPLPRCIARAPWRIPGDAWYNDARMSILSDRDRQAVTQELAKLAGPVKLIVFGATLGGSETSAENERLMQEVADCSPQVTLVPYNLHIDRDRAAAYGVERVPATIVEGARDYGLRFFGIPMGYEFSNLIDGMLVASSGEPKLSPATLEKLATLTEPVHLQVFATPT